MTVETSKVSSIAAAIGRGVKKQDSHLVTDDETSQLWDKIEADHKKILRENPHARIEIPNDPDF